ncbi:MAG: CdaR family protein [Treponema sp.]|nr:CdaR family protein [Treponema sp.]
MKVKSLLNKITSNWLVKTCCIIAAIVLYLFGRTARIEKKSFTVPLNVIQDGTMVNTHALPSTVTVSVRAESQKMPEITSNQIKAGVDLSYFTKEGSFDIPVNLEIASDVLLIDPVEIIVEPEAIKVTLEERIRKSVPINASISGLPMHGYEVKDVKVTPDYAVIAGPKSIVESISSLSTDEVVISNLKDTVNQETKLHNVSRHIKIVTPYRANVSVSFQASLITKEFTDVNLHLTGLDSKFQIDDSTKVSFKVSGAELIVEKFLPTNNTVIADCSGITVAGEYELPVIINVPDALKIQNQSVEKIKIKITENKSALSAGEVTGAQN